jgi:hypothetical protein
LHIHMCSIEIASIFLWLSTSQQMYFESSYISFTAGIQVAWLL